MKLRYIIAINGETKESAITSYEGTDWAWRPEDPKEVLEEILWRYGSLSDSKVVGVTEEEFNNAINIQYSPRS